MNFLDNIPPPYPKWEQCNKRIYHKNYVLNKGTNFETCLCSIQCINDYIKESIAIYIKQIRKIVYVNKVYIINE